VYLKPSPQVSIILVQGYLHADLPVGTIIDAKNDPKVRYDYGLDDDETEIHTDLPLFHGQVVLENGGD
jgi:hypothetical protein